MAKMETLKVQMAPERARIVRKKAYMEFNHKKGAISKAINKAMDEWLEKRVAKSKTRLSAILGATKDEKTDSVTLQHEISRMRAGL